jgi:hypothetical protein
MLPPEEFCRSQASCVEEAADVFSRASITTSRATSSGSIAVLSTIPLSTVEAMELLLGRLSKTKTNGEFLASMSSPA